MRCPVCGVDPEKRCLDWRGKEAAEPHAQRVRVSRNAKHPGIAARILALKKQAKFTQTTLAAAVGVSPLTVHHWESGKTMPESEHLAKLCEVEMKHNVRVGRV